MSSAGGFAILALAGVVSVSNHTQSDARPPVLDGVRPVAELTAGLPDPAESGPRSLCGYFAQPNPGPKIEGCLAAAKAAGTLPLIAAVPNPAEGYLALNFDRWVESIDRAVSDTGFTFDRQWLPWRPESSSLESNQVIRLALEAQRRRTADEPGLLLFRRTAKPGATGADEPALLAVLLVGETSTSGVHLKQFAKALKYSSDLCRDCPIRILGPSFSGSFNSLERALKGTDREKMRSVRMISGSATDDAAVVSFRKALPDVWYAATLHSDSFAIQAF
ncbi:MAG TPA: hypothetical protein VES20_08825, partial [Bryobacteraceae bacterium]|nr:hypothetical protein [Bryobacteraceae bacterium]